MKTPGFREDRRTGQFVPTINGVDTSPTSFSAERALEIATEQSKAETPTMKAAREAEERRRSIIKLAKNTIEKEGSLEIDSDAEISEGNDNGCYVQAWAWLPFDNVLDQIPRTQDVADTTDSPERLSASFCSPLVSPVAPE